MITFIRYTQVVFAAVFTYCALSSSATATTLIDYGNAPGIYAAGQGLAVSWQQTSTAQNVSISAVLGPYFQTTTTDPVTAYLTTVVGPGTSLADQVATSIVQVAPFSGTAASYTLFSGLALSPGTYYLVIGNNAGYPVGWVSSTTPGVVEAPGFTYQGAFSVNGTAGPVDPYTPASAFFPIPDSASPAAYGLLFDVTGTVVSASPEPGSWDC